MGQIPSTERSPEKPPPAQAENSAAAAESQPAVVPAAIAATPTPGADKSKPAPAAVPSAPTVTPATISATTRVNLEAAQRQLEGEAAAKGQSFDALSGLRNAIASGQAEKVRDALQQIRNSPELAELSSGLKDRLSTLQGEVEGTLEKPLRKLEEFFGTWPQWARVAIVGTGIGYGIVSLLKGGRWLLRQIRDGIKAGWNKSVGFLKGALKWGAISGGLVGAGILGTKVHEWHKEKKDTPSGGTAA